MTLAKYKTQVISAGREFSLEYIPFSILGIQSALGSPGLARGRIHELLGKTETGKTSLSVDLIQNDQQLNDKRSLYVDIECRFMPPYAAKLGADLDRIDLVYPDSAEQCMDIIIAAAESGDYSIIVLDSVPAIVSDGELEKSFTESENIRANAMILRRFIARIVPILYRTKTTLLLINQLRANQSTLSRSETKPYGPFFMHHACTTILELTYTGKEDEAKKIRLQVTKNSQSGIHGMCDYILYHSRGFAVRENILTLAVQYGIVTHKGQGRYEYQDLKAHGEKKALEVFPLDEIRYKVLWFMQTGEITGSE